MLSNVDFSTTRPEQDHNRHQKSLIKYAINQAHIIKISLPSAIIQKKYINGYLKTNYIKKNVRKTNDMDCNINNITNINRKHCKNPLKMK